jgi:Cytochrome C oxidase, cbb3-type, subunit III
LTDPIFKNARPSVGVNWFYLKEKTMKKSEFTRRLYLTAGLGLVLILGFAGFSYFSTDAKASPPWRPLVRQNRCETCGDGSEMGGSWFWMRSPEQEKVVVAGLFNRYCIRCHGVDGRGVWDIPGVPDFTNTRWQTSRSDDQIARILIEGRGAVMPPFRGTVTLEEAWAMARYLRTFIPGTEVSRPDVSSAEKINPPKMELPKVK